MIEICDSTNGRGPPLCVSLSRWAPLITPGCLPVPPGNASGGRIAPATGPLFTTAGANGGHLLLPPPVRSPPWDFDRCATEAETIRIKKKKESLVSVVLIN